MSKSRLTVVVVAGVVFALAAAGCSSSSKSSASTTTTASTAAPKAPAAIPTAKTVDQPVTYGYYDGHVDWMLSTDVSDKARPRRAISTTPPR